MQKESFQYSYGKTEYVIAFLPFLLMGISVPLLLINMLVLLADFAARKSALDYWGHLLGLIISLALVLIICLATVNQHNKILVTENGLKVRVFAVLYHWIEVPWREILGVEPAKRPDRWMKTLWVIQVTKLTFWHRCLSFVFHTGNHPIILISSDLENREVLLNIVRDNLKSKA